MPQTDGQIESKQLGTSSVNSRVIDDLRSSNYNGSKTDPESTPGNAGWQILKSGVAVFNNAIIRGLLSAAEIISGDLNIRSAGRLTVGDTGTEEAPIDPLVILDVNGLDIGSGLVVVDETGLQVGTDVVIDSTGLQVIGGYVTPIWPTGAGTSFGNVSLSTSLAIVGSVSFTPPSWVETVRVMSIVHATISNTSGSQYNVTIGLTNDEGGVDDDRASRIQTVPNNTTQNVVVANYDDLSHGDPFDVEIDAVLNAGTNAVNDFGLSVLVFGFRN